MRLYIPFILAMTGKILIFDYFILNKRSRVGHSLLNIFLDPGSLDMNMWFIVYSLSQKDEVLMGIGHRA
jgi:hypothetical protein